MEGFSGHEFTHKSGETTFYWDGGPKDGPLLIFIHGWPDIAETWKKQLPVFAKKGFRVVAPDTRGYGKSSCPKDRRKYSLEVLNGEMLDLLQQTGRSKAVWIGHDWGCGLVASFVAHYPEACEAVALICVPYGTLEKGVDYLVSLVNRDLYPESEYPYGQWEYMKLYEENPEEADRQLEACAEKLTKVLYLPGDPKSFGQPATTSRVLRDGFFGGSPDNIPDIPLEMSSLDEDLYNKLLQQHKSRGFYPATSYYMNHDINKVYDDKKKNDGVLEMPVLFIDAKYDAVCSPSTSPKLAEPQRKLCKNLTETQIEAAHWVHLEKPGEFNEALSSWLSKSGIKA